jgi:glycosyltransferase involved in cell wall biosynthesis
MVLERIKQFKTWEPTRDSTLTIRKPPQIIFDADDHIEYVDVFNPKYCTLGTRLPDGTIIKPGAQIHAEVADNEQVLLWEDGQTYPDGTFAVEENHKKIRRLKLIARGADGVTVSTEALAKVFRKYGAKNVHVFPNSLRDVDYPEIRVERPRNKVRILWQGGYSHFIDWHPLREALGNVFRARPNAELWIWGMLFPAVHREVPEKQLRFVPWMPYTKYTLRLATIGHHINLAPLADHPFNRTKSNIKWLESSAITRPAATLAADELPYKCIEEGETGLLYKNPAEFEEKLLALIDDAALRQKLANNAHDAVWDGWDAAKTVRPLYRYYMNMRESR